jgi:hypothetical protein
LEFLVTATPPLGHLLTRFVECGVTSAEKLANIATQTDREVEAFLQKLQNDYAMVAHEDLTQWEYRALQARFYRYRREV